MEFHRSAFKHGDYESAILHAIDHAITVQLVIHAMALRPAYYNLLPAGEDDS